MQAPKHSTTHRHAWLTRANSVILEKAVKGHSVSTLNQLSQVPKLSEVVVVVVVVVVGYTGMWSTHHSCAVAAHKGG